MILPRRHMAREIFQEGLARRPCLLGSLSWDLRAAQFCRGLVTSSSAFVRVGERRRSPRQLIQNKIPRADIATLACILHLLIYNLRVLFKNPVEGHLPPECEAVLSLDGVQVYVGPVTLFCKSPPLPLGQAWPQRVCQRGMTRTQFLNFSFSQVAAALLGKASLCRT